MSTEETNKTSAPKTTTTAAKPKAAAKKPATKAAAAKKTTAKKTAAKKPAAKKAAKPRTAAQLRSEAEAKAVHAAKLDAEAAKSRFEEIQDTAVEYAKTAVDVPVGAALNLSDKVNELVEDWSDQTAAEKKVKGYRADLTKTFKRAERRGTTTRRKATTKAKKTRNSLERKVRKQQKSIEKSIRSTNKDLNKQFDSGVDTLTQRVNQVGNDVSRLAGEQGKKAQDLVNKVTEQLNQLV